jgi:hypothetical protein
MRPAAQVHLVPKSSRKSSKWTSGIPACAAARCESVEKPRQFGLVTTIKSGSIHWKLSSRMYSWSAVNSKSLVVMMVTDRSLSRRIS